MVMKKTSGRVPWRAPGSSRSRDDDGGGLQYVLRKSDSSVRFFPSRGIYRQKGSVRRWTRWSHHLVARPGPGRATQGCGEPLAPLRLISGLCDASGKIEVIWGGPIFSWATRWWWWQRMIVGDNLVSLMNSPRLNPDANAAALKPCRIFTTPHTCARSRRPWNGSLQSTDSQWNNRSH
jgi:hypothetical protein